MKNEYHEEEMKKVKLQTESVCSELPDYVSLFIKSIKQRTEPKTRQAYVMDIRNFFEYIQEILFNNDDAFKLKDITLETLSSLDRGFFEDYMDHLELYTKKYKKSYIREGKEYFQETTKEFSNDRNSIKRKLSTLRKFYNFLYINGYIENNNIIKVEIPKLKEKEIVYMTENEASDFIEGVVNGINNDSAMSKAYHEKLGVRDKAIVLLLLSTGLRVSECVGLDINDVDFVNNCVRVIRKGGKEGLVYFSDDTHEALKEYLDERKRIIGDIDTENALFLSSRKTRLSKRSIQSLVVKYAKATVPMKNITPHKLRSTYGTALNNKTRDIYVVASVLGHNNINTTAKHYSHMSDQRKEEIRNEVKY